MSKYTSKIGKINKSNELIYNFLTDFNNLKSVIPQDKVKDFVKENKMNYTISVADFSKLAAPYGKIEAIPTTFFIDKQGKIKLATIGVLTSKDVKNILQAQ